MHRITTTLLMAGALAVSLTLGACDDQPEPSHWGEDPTENLQPSEGAQDDAGEDAGAEEKSEESAEDTPSSPPEDASDSSEENADEGESGPANDDQSSINPQAFPGALDELAAAFPGESKSVTRDRAPRAGRWHQGQFSTADSDPGLSTIHAHYIKHDVPLVTEVDPDTHKATVKSSDFVEQADLYAITGSVEQLQSAHTDLLASLKGEGMVEDDGFGELQGFSNRKISAWVELTTDTLYYAREVEGTSTLNENARGTRFGAQLIVQLKTKRTS